MRISRAVSTALLVCSAAVTVAPLQAQMPESYRDLQGRMLQLQRRMLLSMVDSMPENLYRDRVTPIQRDFAQQIGHAAGAVPAILNGFIGGPAPQLPDTATSFGSRAGLRAYVNACYDYADRFLRAQTVAQRDTVVQFFRIRIPAWQVWDELHQHTIWTAGQIVANFRKNGMAPPGFGFF